MQLLSQLQGSCCSGASDQARLTQRLWPFFRHPMASVRLAAVRLFARLVAFPVGRALLTWYADCMPGKTALRACVFIPSVDIDISIDWKFVEARD